MSTVTAKIGAAMSMKMSASSRFWSGGRGSTVGSLGQGGTGVTCLDNDIDRRYICNVARGDRPVYVISIAASLAGCHPRTLRIYEEEGLLDPVRTETNIRLYSDADLARVRCIRYLTQVRGVNLAGVKLLFRFRDAGELVAELAALQTEGEREDEEGDPASARF